MIGKEWIEKSCGASEVIDNLAKELNINKTLSKLLVQRGISTFDEAKDFFRPSLSQLHNPFLMKDMDKAVTRLVQAIENNENILVFGDYDVDGTTAASLQYKFLNTYYNTIDYYIPDRYDEGYGISFKGIDYAIEKKCTLMIALDCGIKAIEKAKYAKDNGIDLIICDHHNPGDVLPDAYAILDPKRVDCEYPYKELSGCGVGFKLLHGFCLQQNIPLEKLFEYLDILAVSICSDIVPITGENRILCAHGIKKLVESPCIGLEAIKRTAAIEDEDLSVTDIVFKIGPRINAAGRIMSGRHAVQLLISDDFSQAMPIAEKIDEYNTSRKNIDVKITNEALKIIENDASLLHAKTTVLYNSNWHKGVIGIVASRLIEQYYRPTIILTESNGDISGSARSVDGFDLYSALEACSDLLEKWGGHMYAAGLTLKKDNLEAFQQRFEKVVSETILPHQTVPKIDIDTDISLEEINPKFYRILKQLAPFGPQNMTPVFVCKQVKDNGKGQSIGKEKNHLKLQIKQNGSGTFPAIGFNIGSLLPDIQNKEFDVCFTIEENVYKGRTTLQLNIKDIKASK